jgi:hypothetical protein
MVAVVDAVGLLAILFVNTAVAALLTRFFRVQLVTDWGSAIYTVLFVPVVQLVVLLVVSGLFKLGPNVGSPAAAVGLAVVLPLSLGVAFDFFWMPAPDDLEVPDRGRDRRRSL